METCREEPRIGMIGEFGCQGAAVCRTLRNKIVLRNKTYECPAEVQRMAYREGLSCDGSDVGS